MCFADTELKKQYCFNIWMIFIEFQGVLLKHIIGLVFHRLYFNKSIVRYTLRGDGNVSLPLRTLDSASGILHVLPS